MTGIADGQRDMYNHGLATFVLGQAYGMTSTPDRRMGTVLANALKFTRQGSVKLRIQRDAEGGSVTLRAERQGRQREAGSREHHDAGWRHQPDERHDQRATERGAEQIGSVEPVDPLQLWRSPSTWPSSCRSRLCTSICCLPGEL